MRTLPNFFFIKLYCHANLDTFCYRRVSWYKGKVREWVGMNNNDLDDGDDINAEKEGKRRCRGKGVPMAGDIEVEGAR